MCFSLNGAVWTIKQFVSCCRNLFKRISFNNIYLRIRYCYTRQCQSESTMRARANVLTKSCSFAVEVKEYGGPVFDHCKLFYNVFIIISWVYFLDLFVLSWNLKKNKHTKLIFFSLSLHKQSSKFSQHCFDKEGGILKLKVVLNFVQWLLGSVPTDII